MDKFCEKSKVLFTKQGRTENKAVGQRRSAACVRFLPKNPGKFEARSPKGAIQKSFATISECDLMVS